MFSPNEVKVRSWKLWEEQIDRALKEHNWNQSLVCELSLPTVDNRLRALVQQYSELGWTVIMDVDKQENETRLMFCTGTEVFDGSSQ